MAVNYQIKTRFSYRGNSRKQPPNKTVLLIVAIVFAGFSLLGIRDIMVEHALDSRGVPASAVVTERYHSSGKGSTTWLKFAYNVSGKLFVGKSSVTYPFYKSVIVGESVQIQYLPDSPSTARCVQATGYRQGYLLCATGIITVVLLGAIYVSGRTRRATGVMP